MDGKSLCITLFMPAILLIAARCTQPAKPLATPGTDCRRDCSPRSADTLTSHGPGNPRTSPDPAGSLECR